MGEPGTGRGRTPGSTGPNHDPGNPGPLVRPEPGAARPPSLGADSAWARLSALPFCPSSSFTPAESWARGWAARAVTWRILALVWPWGSPRGSPRAGDPNSALARSVLPRSRAPPLRSFLNPSLSVSLHVFNLYLFLFCILK